MLKDTVQVNRDVLVQVLEVLVRASSYYDTYAEIDALRAALAEQPAEKEATMPITDDNGKVLRPQYRVVKQRGNWFLIYDQHQIGNTVCHEFRIQKIRHDIALYPGITLEEAQARFAAKVEADNE